MTTREDFPSEEQQQRAKWDLLLADLEFRHQQLKISKWEAPKVFAMIAIAVAALFAASGMAGHIWPPQPQQINGQISIHLDQPIQVKIVP